MRRTATPSRSRGRRGPRRRGAIVATIGATALGLSACGAGSEVGGQDVAVECDIDAPEQDTTVNVLSYNSTATDPFIDAITGNCASDTLTVNHPATDLTGQKQRAVQSLSGGSASYDLIEQFGTVYPLYADRGWTVPLDDLIAENSDRYDLDAIDPDLLAAHAYDGQQYGLPTYWSVNHLVYRADIFDELGLEPPTTFEELRTVSQAIADADVVDTPLAIPMEPTNDVQTIFGQTLRSLGGDFFVEGEATPALNGPDAVEAVEQIQSLLPYMSDQVLSFSSPEVTTQLQTGQAAMGMLVSGRLGPLVDPEASEFAEDFAFATPPSVEEGGAPLSFLSVDGLALAANSEADPELLFQLAAVATSEQAGEAVIPNALPARLDLLEGSDIPFAENAQQILAEADPKPLNPVPYMADVYSVIGAPLGSTVAGSTDVQTGLDEAQQAAVDAIEAGGFTD